MKVLTLASLASMLALATIGEAFAHGDHDHPTCKPGYMLDANHKCVKKS